jgi:hypothetical protein
MYFQYIISCILWTSRYQAQLQKNLLYLAAIADAQPQPPQNPAGRPQVSSVEISNLSVAALCLSHLNFHFFAYR